MSIRSLKYHESKIKVITYIRKKTTFDFGFGIFSNLRIIQLDLIFLGIHIDFKSFRTAFVIGIPFWYSYWFVAMSVKAYKEL